MIKRFGVRLGTLAALATLATGFVPLMILSVVTNSFWPKSRVLVPVFFVPSVLLGDSVLLPLFNARAAIIVRQVLRDPFVSRRKLHLTIAAIGVGTFSAAVNVYVHRLWVRDQHTGFIALEPGQLSLAGQWHLTFSSLELAFILWVLWVCIVARKDLDRDEVLRLWRIFLIYSALSIGDFAVWNLLISQSMHFSLTDMIALLPFPLAATTLFIFSKVMPDQSKSVIRS